VGEPELFVDSLLVGIDRLRTDEKLLPDLRGTVAAGNVAKNIALSFRELLVPLALIGML
jgi:hypothetical protein